MKEMAKDEALKAALKLLKEYRLGRVEGIPIIFPYEVEQACVLVSEQEDMPEPVYEYQWLLLYKAGFGTVDTSAFYKTEGEMLDDYSDHKVMILERLDRYKRIAME